MRHARLAFIRVTAFLTVTSALIVSSLAAEQLTAINAVAAWESGCNAIKSYDVYLTAEQKSFLNPAAGWSPWPDPLVEEGAVREVFKSGKFRIERDIKKPGDPPSETVVWNGEFSRVFLPKEEQFVIERRIRLQFGAVVDYEAWFRRPLSPLSYFEILRQRPNLKIEAASGDECVLYAPPTNGKFEYAPFGFHVRLDLKKNAMPTRVEYLLSDSGRDIVYSRIENTLAEVLPHVWAPVKAVVTNFPPQAMAGLAKKAAETVNLVNRDLSKFNLDVPDASFTLEAPPGVRVLDLTEN